VSVAVVFETHAISEDNEAGVATGWLPGRLSPRGRELAGELGKRRRADGLSVVFTSDLGRAVETVEIAFAGSALPVVPDTRLRECNYGELNGTPQPMKERMEHLDEPYPGGESWRQAVERVAGFLGELRRGRDCERVLVVGHVATLYGLEIVANRRELEDLIGAPFEWRPGWEFVL
jgi:broad specificity phosphatase PhoE